LDQLIKIHLFGQTFTFRTDFGAQQAETVATMLMDEVERIAGRSGGTTSEMNRLTVMILAALNLANENYELKFSRESGQQGLKQRANRIVSVLDNALEKWERAGARTEEGQPFPGRVP
jgi:cell division protein ZapA (FtsZ GTPase activity inhibitor)